MILYKCTFEHVYVIIYQYVHMHNLVIMTSVHCVQPADHTTAERSKFENIQSESRL